MRRKFWLAILAVVVLAGTAPVRGQDVKDILGIIPADALGFVLVNRLDQANDKFMAVAKKLGVPMPIAPLDHAKSVGISKGLNTKGSAAVVLLPEDGMPVPLFLLPVSDYKEFLSQFKAKGPGIVEITLGDGKKFAAAGKGKFALLVPGDHRDRLKAVLAKGNLANWAQPVREWLEGNDATFVGTPLGIKQGTLAMDQGVVQLKNITGANDDLGFLKAWIEGFEAMLKTVETELTHAAVGTRIDQAGNLIVESRGMFAKGGALAKGAAGVKPLPGGPLANLPSGPYALALGGPMPAGLMEAMSKMGTEFVKIAVKQAGGKLPEDKWRKFDQASGQIYKSMTGMNYVIRSGKGKEGMLGGMVATITTDSSAKYLQNYEKMIAQTNALYKELDLPMLPITKLEKKKVGNLTVLESTMTFDDPMQKTIMEAMFGPGGKMTYSVAALDAKTVLSACRSAQGLPEAIKNIKKGSLKDDADVARALGLLPKDSQWVALFDPHGMTAMASQAVDTFGIPVPIPDFPQTPPVGLGVKLSESGVIMQIVIPAQVLEGVGRLRGGS